MTFKNFGFLLIVIFIVGCKTTSEESLRTRTSLDFDWKFIQKDITTAKNPAFDDSAWRLLNVPHDWSIEGEYKEENPSGKAGAFLPTGIGWYRKDITIEKLAPNEKVFIEFDGVYMNSDVWINGQHLGNRPYGYASFSYDLTPYLNEGSNILAVRVDHSKAPSGRWYTGSGIYRHVWLTKTSNIYIPQWGTFVTTPEVSEKLSQVKIVTQLKNETGKSQQVVITSIVKDASGKEVSNATSKTILDDNLEVEQFCNVENPALWSPDSPNIYSLESVIMVDGVVKDRYTTPFGIRSIEMRGSKGFFLNGKSIKFKGLSNHHAAGAVGSAVPNDVLYRRLKLLKEMGCNALRTAHNPFSPEFYELCDTMGFMVMDEAFDGWWNPKAKFDYGNYFEEWWKQDLTDFMKRDRNHPSVVIWSVGNEVHKFKPEEQKTLVDFTRKMDNTRPITQGRGYSAPYIDIAGFNGHGEFKGTLEKYHIKNPDKLIIGTEITHTLQTRGVYRTKTWYRTKDNPAPWEKPSQFKKMEKKVYKIKDLTEEEVFTGITKKYQSSYDNSIVRIGVQDDWKRVEKYDYYIGNFRWTGFDYLGESFSWPARTANFGIIDLAGFPKDHYYLYQSLWSDKPMVHMLPHWTHPGKEGVEIPVVVYTNCDEAELFLNGNSLGKKEHKGNQLVWNVPYQKGEIKVVGYNEGKEIDVKTFKTAEEPIGIQITSDINSIRANGTDVVHFEITIVDEFGTMVPNANNEVEIQISGAAKLIGSENGDILDVSNAKSSKRKAFNGKALFIIQSTRKAKDSVNVTFTSKGLKKEVFKVLVN